MMAYCKQDICRGFIRLILVLVIAFGTVLPIHVSAVSAAVPEHSIELTGEFDSKRFNLSASTGDLFNLEGVAPGDSWKGKVHVKNSCSETMEVSIVSILNNLKKDTFLYDQLELNIFMGKNTVYSGSYGATNSPVSDWYAIPSSEQITFDIEVKLPEATGNEGQGREMDSTWIFEARIPRPVSSTPGESADLPYYVHYVDTDNMKLHDTKVGYGKYKNQIIEHAISIPGYTPDAQKKTLVLTQTDNTLYFTYEKTEAAADSGSQTPQAPSDSNFTAETVKTGDDMTESNTLPVFGWIIRISCMIAILATILRIYQAKKHFVNK